MESSRQTAREIQAIEMAWHALHNVVIDQNNVSREAELADWQKAGNECHQHEQKTLDELHHDLFGVCKKSEILVPKNANDEEDEERQFFESFMFEEALDEKRKTFLLELIKLKAHDVAIRLAMELESSDMLSFIFGELTKVTEAMQIVKMIAALAIPRSRKSFLFLGLFDQTEAEEYLSAFRASLLVRLMQFLTKSALGLSSAEVAECRSLAHDFTRLWWFKREPKFLAMATTLVRTDRTWTSQMRLARATGSLEEYLVLIEYIQRCSDEELIAFWVKDMALTLVLLQDLITRPEMVLDRIRRYVTPLSKEDLEALLVMSPPKQRLVYQKRLKAAAERATK